MTERFLSDVPPGPTALAAATAHARHTLGGAAPHDTPIVAAGGTATTLAAVLGGIEPYDADRVHGSVITREALEGVVERLAALDSEALATVVGLPPDRADIALGGAVALVSVLEELGAQELVVSDRGLRWGVVYSAA